jgi:zinc transporter ZupT
MDYLPILLSAITAFAATMSAGLLVHRFKKNFGLLCAFVAGIVLALVAFDMVPTILALVPQSEISFALPIVFGVAGFTSLYLVVGLFHMRKSVNTESKRTIGIISTAEFCSHGFLEGLAIGVGFQFQFGLGILVAVAVISHDFCDGLSTLALMLNSGNSTKASLGMLFVDAIAPLLGAATVLFLTVEHSFMLLGLSFLVGSFIYIGGLTLLPQAYAIKRPRVTAALFSFGFAIIFLLSLAINA